MDRNTLIRLLELGLHDRRKTLETSKEEAIYPNVEASSQDRSHTKTKPDSNGITGMGEEIRKHGANDASPESKSER